MVRSPGISSRFVSSVQSKKALLAMYNSGGGTAISRSTAQPIKAFFHVDGLQCSWQPDALESYALGECELSDFRYASTSKVDKCKEFAIITGMRT